MVWNGSVGITTPTDRRSSSDFHKNPSLGCAAEKCPYEWTNATPCVKFRPQIALDGSGLLSTRGAICALPLSIGFGATGGCPSVSLPTVRLERGSTYTVPLKM